jgi:hypothetical protein
MSRVAIFGLGLDSGRMNVPTDSSSWLALIGSGLDRARTLGMYEERTRSVAYRRIRLGYLTCCQKVVWGHM